MVVFGAVQEGATESEDGTSGVSQEAEGEWEVAPGCGVEACAGRIGGGRNCALRHTTICATLWSVR